MNYFPRILSSIKILSGFYKNNGLVNVKDLAFLFLHTCIIAYSVLFYNSTLVNTWSLVRTDLVLLVYFGELGIPKENERHVSSFTISYP